MPRMDVLKHLLGQRFQRCFSNRNGFFFQILLIVDTRAITEIVTMGRGQCVCANVVAFLFVRTHVHTSVWAPVSVFM